MSLRVFLIASFAVLVAGRDELQAQLPPEEALKTFTVAEGLELSLFAAEPMFTNPTCIDVDHKGRVWVCESVNYRCKLRNRPLNRPEGDRIVVLEDTNSDGKADKAVTFYQAPDLLAPLGIAVAPYPDGKGCKVYVCHSPHIYTFEDADGDLKADGPPKILLTGFKGYDHDHGVHGIHFGPDGKLYFSVGDQGVDGLQSSDGKGPRWKTNRTDCQAGTAWRCNLDGTNLELLAHNFRNPYEPAVNSFGTMFISDNDDDGNQQTRICYVMYGGNYGYWPRGKGESHWHEEQPGVVHKVLRTGFGSPTGMCWYEGTLLREALSGQRTANGKANSALRTQPSTLYGLLLHTDAGPREVRCFRVYPMGAGYELDKLVMATSSDNWFRPSDVCVAPDGSVFVSDWYDPGVGGHGMGDTARGRVYRLAARGGKALGAPRADLTTATGQGECLMSPNLATRQRVLPLLGSLPSHELPRIVGSPGPDEPWRQARAQWVVSEAYHRAGSSTAGSYLVRRIHEAKDGQAQALCVRLFWDHQKSTPAEYGAQFPRLFLGWLPSAHREGLLTIRHSDPTQIKDHLYVLAKNYDGHDHFYLAAIGIAVGTDPKRREIILADFEKQFPEWNDKVAKLVWELRPPQVIAKLDQKVSDPKLTPAQKGFILDILAVSDAEAGGKTVIKLLGERGTPAELRDQALKTLATHLPSKWSSLRQGPEIKELIDGLLARPETRTRALELIPLAERGEYASTVSQLAEKKDEPPAVRAAAIRALAEFKTGPSVRALVRLLQEEAFRKQAIEALGRMQTDAALAPLKQMIRDAKESEETRHDAAAALASSRPGTIWLLDAHARKELPEAVVPEAARLLRYSPHQDLRNRALMLFPMAAKMDPKNPPAINQLLRRRGDPERGREVFANNKDAGCIRCHSVAGAGGNIGPDLSMIGKKGSRENLFDSILFPDKAVADQYIQAVIEDKKGVVLTGLVVEDTAEHVVIRDALGKDTKVMKKDIEQRQKSPKSIMPADLIAYLNEQDLIDLVAYLETLQTPVITPGTWRPIGLIW